MAAPSLNSYEYQYKDNGVLLNGGAVRPFIDVTNITGLDFPELDVKTTDADGMHGSYSYAQYFGSRTVVIDATLYSDTPDDTLNALKANFMPVASAQKFYIKQTAEQRFLLCKPIGFNFGVSRSWSYGTVPIQIQLLAGDPRFYKDINYVTISNNVNFTVNNAGIVTSFPRITIVGTYTDLRLYNVSDPASGDLFYDRTIVSTSSVTTIDLYDRTIYVNNERSTRDLTTNKWFGLEPGNNTWRLKLTNPNVSSITSTFRSAWL